jgi:hypothetical protein
LKGNLSCIFWQEGGADRFIFYGSKTEIDVGAERLHSIFGRWYELKGKLAQCAKENTMSPLMARLVTSLVK